MGIDDRHYVRNTGQRAAGFGLPRWSGNTWIIVLCVAVFVIDRFLPTVNVPMQTVVHPGVSDFDRSLLIQSPPIPVGPTEFIRQLALPDGTVIAEDHYVRMQLLEAYLHFSTALAFLHPEVWRFIGFQFLHASAMHLVFNMLGLYFFGPMVERYLGRKRYLAFYLLCGIFGALMYLLLNLGGYAVEQITEAPVRVPGLLFSNISTPLIGASAGVFGVLMAGAFLAPNAIVYLFFAIPMKLKHVAYGLLAVAMLTVLTSGHNAGGEAAHIGGALAGFYFIRRPRHLHGFFDLVGRADPTSHHYRHSRGRGAPTGGALEKIEIDRILDKIQTDGLQSLTDREKRVLQEASERP